MKHYRGLHITNLISTVPCLQNHSGQNMFQTQLINKTTTNKQIRNKLTVSSKRFSLEHPLQWWEVYDKHLSHQTKSDGDQEHFVGEQAHLEDRLGL